MSKIVGIDGKERHDPRVPNQEVIRSLEDALECARSGEMSGFVMVRVYYDDATQPVMCGHFPNREVVGTLEEIKFNIFTHEHQTT